MVITRTPFRISFAGGGTDIASYYKTGYGAVVSTAINKYMYITVNKRFDDSIRLSYSKTEITDSVDDLEHDIVKAALKMTGITKGIEITSVSDIPAGTGLGSSSSFTVGLLNALYSYKGKLCSPHELAEKACHLEIDILKHPIGKQDQFAAAYGGTNYFRFNADESVTVKPINFSSNALTDINSKLSLWYTGISRSADSILSKQSNNTFSKLEILDFIRNQADALAQDLTDNGFPQSLGKILHEGWMKKKSVNDSISNGIIDNLYNIALSNGAQGGKILGAGGGGFLLLYSDAEKHDDLKSALGLDDMPFGINSEGSKIIFSSDD